MQNYFPDVLQRECADFRKHAANLLTVLTLEKESLQITEEQRASAVHAVEWLSLAYPPNNPLQEELNMQLTKAIELILGRAQENTRSEMMGLDVNLWKLANELNERMFAALRGENREHKIPEPQKAGEVR